MVASGEQKPIFPKISAENDDVQPTEIESLCMNCHENGSTKLLLTKIPFFKDLILSSFSCDHCGYANNEVQSADAIQEQGVKITLKVDASKDLNRQIVKTQFTTISIPELDFEIPPESQKGILTTIEGIIDRAVTGLQQEQPVRRIMDPTTAQKIDDFIERLGGLKTRESHFQVIVDDPSGNCFLENPHAPSDDPMMSTVHYARSREQDQMVGIYQDGVVPAKPEENICPDEVLQFKTNCPNCNAPVDTNMKLVDIPHFKQIVLMATSCDSCGERTNEVKSATGFEEKGKRITLNITDSSDLNRDVLKSESCIVRIPEVEMEIGGHAISGKFTTVEGLLTDIQDLVVKKNPFFVGDSADPDMKKKVDAFYEKVEQLKKGDTTFTFIMDDPAGNSYLQNVYAPEEDPEMKVEVYERTFEQNEELGLNDMKTENYQVDTPGR